jgi:hypothetical protein
MRGTRASAGRSAAAGVWNTLQLEWEAGLRRLPFFTQRLAVVLLGLLVVSLALVGATVILWSGAQRSELPLGPPPEHRNPPGPTRANGLQLPRAPREHSGAALPAGARSATSSPPAPAGAASGPAQATAAGLTASTNTTAPASTTGTTSGPPTTTAPTSSGQQLTPLTVPPVLTTLLP